MNRKIVEFWKTMKEKTLFIRVTVAGILFALGFWGVLFPQYLFTGDCVKICGGDGQEGAEEESADENLYRGIGTAKPEQIEVKIGILEWAKR